MNQQKTDQILETVQKSGVLTPDTVLEIMDHQELDEQEWEKLLDGLYQKNTLLQPGKIKSENRQREGYNRFAAEYLETLRRMPVPDKEAFSALFLQLKNNDGQAAEKMTEAFLPYIAERAAFWHPQQESLVQDLIGEGCAGTLYAVRGRAVAEETENADQFRSAVEWWINGYMFKFVYTAICSSGISDHLADRMNMVMNARSRLGGILGHAPAAAEIAEETGLDIAEVMTILGELRIQEKNMQDQPSLLRQPRTADIDDAADRIGFEEDINRLDIEERYILQALYGVGGRPRLSVEEAAQQMNMSIEDIRSIEKSALDKLKQIKGE